MLDMHLMKTVLSSRDTTLIQPITGQGGQFIFTLLAKHPLQIDSRISKPEVRWSPHQETQLTKSVIQILMKATDGLGVILENRFYGRSFPLANSSTDNLRYLTTDQSSLPSQAGFIYTKIL